MEHILIVANKTTTDDYSIKRDRSHLLQEPAAMHSRDWQQLPAPTAVCRFLEPACTLDVSYLHLPDTSQGGGSLGKN